MTLAERDRQGGSGDGEQGRVSSPQVSSSPSTASSCSPPTTAPLTFTQAFSTASQSQANQETVYETAARLLFMAVRWTKNLASFAALPFRDQVLLLEESWSELFLLCSIQWCLPLPSPSLFSPAELPDLPPSLQTVLAQLESSLQRFRQLNIDPAEFACLKAIILFKPDVGGLKDCGEVENLQDQSLAMLQHHVSSTSSGGVGSGVVQPGSGHHHHHRLATRFPRLLLALSALQSPPTGSIE